MSWGSSDYQRELFRDVKAYLKRYPDATAEEKQDLLKWVMAGFSVGDNPYRLYDDAGFPMDFIAGCRIGAEMVRDFSEDPDNFPEKWGISTDQSNMKKAAASMDDLPF